jgi:broad specificity phosphatase PhoE
MLKMIFLVRHGQTEWNRDGLFRGHKDIPLSKRGRAQARAAGERLVSCTIGCIYTSPLKRSLETATLISERTGANIKIDEGFRDIHFGEWEGKTVKEVQEKYSDSYNLYMLHPEKCIFPNGESLNRCSERSWRSFFSVAKTENQDIVIVTHRVILKLILLGTLGLTTSSFWKIQLDTCSISEITNDNGNFVICRLNSVAHLASAQKKLNDF